MFERFFDDGLAQASFLIGCDRTRQAVVIDPRRDAAVYAEAAAKHGTSIVAAIETHVHADFVSGARELAEMGIRVITGPESGVAYAHHEAQDGEPLVVGDLNLTFLHTPGHTLEHICVLAAAPGQPSRLFSGDLLFVGSVGRPDLAGEALTRRLAGDLFDSLQRILREDDRLEIHPGHGAGSLCAAGIGKEPSTTVGRERRQNPMLQHTDRAAFVAAVLADLPPTPPYFARMKQINTAGPALLASVRAAGRLPALAPAAAAALAADGAALIDLRNAAEFGASHPEGAINIGHGAKVGYWAGWVVPADVPIVLIADDPAEAADARTQLLRVGLDHVEGVLGGGAAAWTRAGLPAAALEQVSPSDVQQAIAARLPMQILDVRSPNEFAAGHIPGAVNIPVGELGARAGELRRDAPTAVLCEGGYRSALAASLLARDGFPRVANVTGGLSAFRAIGATAIAGSL